MPIWSRKTRRRNDGRSCSNRSAVFGDLRAAICGGKSKNENHNLKQINPQIFFFKRYFLVSKKCYNKIFRPTHTEPPMFPQRTRLLSSKGATLMYNCWDRLEFCIKLQKMIFFRFGNWATEIEEAHWTGRNSSSRSNSLLRRSKVCKFQKIKETFAPNWGKTWKLKSLKKNIFGKFQATRSQLPLWLCPRSGLPRWRVAARLRQFQTSREWQEEWCTPHSTINNNSTLGESLLWIRWILGTLKI